VLLKEVIRGRSPVKITVILNKEIILRNMLSFKFSKMTDLLDSVHKKSELSKIGFTLSRTMKQTKDLRHITIYLIPIASTEGVFMM
jgi:hypothetical protein